VGTARAARERWPTVHSQGCASFIRGLVAHKSLAVHRLRAMVSGPMPTVNGLWGQGRRTASGGHGLWLRTLMVRGLVDGPWSAIFASASAYGRAQEPSSSRT
jgi:hypothetical protein